MADRRSQSDESLIVEYFTVQPLAACDAVLNQISDVLRERRPRKAKVDDVKPAAEPTERKTAQKRKAGKEVEPMNLKHPDEPCSNCGEGFSKNIHHMKSWPNYHEFFEVDPNRIIDDVESGGEAKGASG